MTYLTSIATLIAGLWLALQPGAFDTMAGVMLFIVGLNFLALAADATARERRKP